MEGGGGGWGGEFLVTGIFFVTKFLFCFFLGCSINIFLGLVGVHEFFSFKFPLREYFFVPSLRVAFTPHVNFVPGDQLFPLIVVCC